MTESEITGRVKIDLKAAVFIEDDKDATAMACVANPLFDYMELVTVDRVRDHVIYGHEMGENKSLGDFVSQIAEKLGDVAAASNDYQSGELGAFEQLQVALVGLGSKAAVFFEQSWRGARELLDVGVPLPHLSAAPARPRTAMVEQGLAELTKILGESPITVAPLAPDAKPILAFTGGRGAGKDSAAKRLLERYAFVKGSFAAPLKRLVATEFGWDLARLEDLDYKEEFVPEVGMTRREMLIKVGTEWFRSIDPLHWIKRSAPDFRASLMDPTVRGLAVTDLRFQNEIDELRKLFPQNPVLVIRVERVDADNSPNADDAINAWKTIPADLMIAASFGQIPLLHAQIDDFMRVFDTETEVAQ